MLNVTIPDLLADLRAVSERVDGQLRRASEFDFDGAHLIELGWAAREGRVDIRETDVGLDVLFATRDVALDGAA